MIAVEIRDVASVMEAKAAELRALADQVEAIEDQPPPDTSELDAALATIASLQAELAACQAALADCQAGGGTPPTGNPLRLTGSLDHERGGPFWGQTVQYRVMSADLSSVLASGSLLLQEQAPLEGSSFSVQMQKSQFLIDFVGPYQVGDPVPVLMYLHDEAAPLDRTVRSSFFWTDAKAQA